MTATTAQPGNYTQPLSNHLAGQQQSQQPLQQDSATTQFGSTNRVTRSMPETTTSSTDAAFNQADNASPPTRTDIPVMVNAFQRSLLPQCSQETTSSLPSNQLASQQHSQQLTQLNITQQQLTNTCNNNSILLPHLVSH